MSPQVVPSPTSFALLDPSTANPADRCRRAFSRVPMCCDAWLYDDDGRPVSMGTTMDVSDGGMQLALPAGSGLKAGREVHYRMAVPRRRERGGYIEEVHGQATVVRTHTLKGALAETLTVGLKFATPMPLLATSTVRGCVVTANRANGN